MQTIPSVSVGSLKAGEYDYDNLAEGQGFTTAGVTVTEAHVVGFAGISGDLFDLHMDDEFARAQGFPGRIAHGLWDPLESTCRHASLSIL